jgi:hypothetical protein
MGAEGGHVTACGMTTFSEIWQSSPLDGRFSRAILMKVDLRLGTQSSFLFLLKNVEVNFVQGAKGHTAVIPPHDPGPRWR